MKLLVTYKSIRFPSKTWQVRFELGDEQNELAALHHGWTHNAEIIEHRSVS